MVPGYLLAYIYNCRQPHDPTHAAKAKNTSLLKQTSNEIIIDPHEPSRANNSARSKEYPKDQSLQAARLANFVGIEEESHVSENACRYAK
jgi:hypothetical protein